MINSLESLIQHAPEIEKKLGYVFKDKQLLALAFIHRSFVNENRHTTTAHNERLEFLGDSILGLLIADYLYRYLPSTPEGELSHLRSRLVEASCCINYVEQLSVAPYLLLGRGEQMNQGRGRDSILADLFEALIGAIYLDGGMEAVRPFFFKNFSPTIHATLQKPNRNWKAELQDYSQKGYQQPPSYVITEESGPDHNKTFHISVTINGEVVGTGVGCSKKEAQQKAAEAALSHLESQKEQ